MKVRRFRQLFFAIMLGAAAAPSARAQQFSPPTVESDVFAENRPVSFQPSADVPAEVPPPATRMNLPEAPATVVEGQLGGVGSQGSAVSGGQRVTSANLTPTILADTGSSTTVVTAEQIAQRGGQPNVAEILRGLPGVDVVRQGSPGSATTVFLRGAGGQHTKVLIDNVPANDPISPTRAFDFANLSVDNIERIEIIRGPQSVLYGSDAIGGVINIITRKGQGANSGRVSAMGGSFSTANMAMNTSGSRGPVYYSFGGSYFDTNGFSASDRRMLGNTEADGFQLGTLSSRVGWQPSDQFDVDVVLRYNQGYTDIDARGGNFGDDPNDSTQMQQTVVGVRLHSRNFPGWYEQTTSYYVSDIHRGFRDPLPVGFNFFANYQGTTQQIDSRHTFHILDTDWIGNDITVGGLYQTEVGSAQDNFGGFFPSTSLDDGAVYGQEQLRIGDNWFSTVGYRSDHYNLYGANDTYRVTSLYRLPSTKTAFRGTIGTGFRAPSLSERFDPFAGNPNLRPEYSKGWDCGIEQPLFDGTLVPSVTYFRNDFRNFIDFNPNLFTSVNYPYAQTSGVEFNTLFVLTSYSTLTTAYTYTDTEAPSIATPPPLGDSAPLLRRPRNKLGVVYNRRFYDNRINWNVNCSFVGRRDDAFGFPATRVQLGGYSLVNTGLTYDVSRRMQLFGRVDNVLNQHYQEVYGYGTPRLSAYAGASLMW
jgi:vitamin B12 transporter